MAKQVTVTQAQKTAAQYALSRRSRDGREVPSALAKIARAASVPSLHPAPEGGS